MVFSKKKINSKNLSIVVQGAVDKSVFKAPYLKNIEGEITKLCLHSLRKNFIGAEIILSTWKGTDVSNLDFDKVVFSDDPGAAIFDEVRGRYQNINRQLVTTLSGIKVATKEYVLKVRTDMYFENSNCLHLSACFKKTSSDFKIFEDKVVISNITTRNPFKEQQCPYHACDWFYLGKKIDIESIFTIPIMPAEYMNWYKNRDFPVNHPDKTNLCRYNSESYIWSECIKKKLPIHFEHTSDLSNDNIRTSELIFANNTIICNISQLGFKSLKYNWTLSYLDMCYTHKEWKKLYDEFILDKRKKRSSYDYERAIYSWTKLNSIPNFYPTINDKISWLLFLNILFKQILKKANFFLKRTYYKIRTF